MVFSRENSFSIEITDENSDKNDSIQYLIELEGLLFAFLGNKITKILPAEITDPENLNPETRHSYQNIYSIGCNNSFVARTIIQSKQILDAIRISDALDKQIILNHVWSCSKILFASEEAFYKIYKDILEKIPLCDEIVEKGKNESHIKTLPQVSELDSRASVFLGHTKRLLEKTYKVLGIFYEAPDYGSDFEQYGIWMKKNYPDKIQIIELLEQDISWVKTIGLLRNALEINHSRKNFYVDIQNFKLNTGNKISSPSWKHDLSSKNGNVQDYYSDILSDMEVYISNTFSFLEELLVLCFEDHAKENYGVFKKQAKDVEDNCPVLYVGTYLKKI